MARNKSSRRKKSGTSAPFFSKESNSKFGRALHRFFSRLQSLLSSPLIIGIPFALLTFIVSVDFSIFLNGLTERASNEYLRSPESLRLVAEGEVLKAQYLPYVYALTMFLALINYKVLLDFGKQNTHLLFTVAIILFGVTYSVEPTKVVTNSIIISVGTVASILLASSFLKNRSFNALFLALLIPMAVIHLTSEYTFIINGTNPLDIIDSKNRFRGITFNPNGLALSGILGVWAACGLLVAQRVSLLLKAISVLLVVLFIFNILLAESGTSLTICIAGLVLGTYLKIVQKFKIEYRLINNLIVMAVGLGIAFYITVKSSSDELLSSFTGSLGKDSSFTGRTELWATAIDAIKDRPILGYGYDSHISIKSNPAYDISYNHYHNGYLDTLIAGGPALLLLLIYNFSKHWKQVSALMKTNSTAFVLLIPLMMIVMYNLSEYSMMRPHSAMWLMYVAAFSAALFAGQNSKNISNSRSSFWRTRKKPSNRSKEKRYHFG